MTKILPLTGNKGNEAFYLMAAGLGMGADLADRWLRLRIEAFEKSAPRREDEGYKGVWGLCRINGELTVIPLSFHYKDELDGVGCWETGGFTSETGKLLNPVDWAILLPDPGDLNVAA